MLSMESPVEQKSITKVPYVTVSGVIFIIILFTFLWRPLNQGRITYVPINGQTSQPTVTPPVTTQPHIGDTTIELVDNQQTTAYPGESVDQVDDELLQDEIDEAIDEDKNEVTYTIENGDTLLGVMVQYGVNRADILLLTKQHKQLTNLRIGQQIAWTMDDENNLTSFNWTVSNNNIRAFSRNGDQFIENVEQRTSVWKTVAISGIINSSFVADAKRVGLTSSEIATITRALQWQLDFRRLQKDDQFAVILSRETVGADHKNSQLLAVRMKNVNRNYYAVLADDGRYYDLNAKGLSRGFLRYPLERAARVSSPFNPRRLHPITGQIAPHNGVDFAVSRGTAVLAIGDGEVVAAKYSGTAGNYITIRHGRQYMTRFMHLDKILVKPGQQVKQGDRIALSGNTGRSTGPHLHFELLIDGKPVNPLSANLPQANGLTGKSKSIFLDQVKTLKPQLILDSEKE